MNIDKQAQRTDLLIANALETAKQLRELQESSVAEAIFESIVENENGKEIQFERPISDLAYAAFLKIERLVEALEAAERERDNWHTSFDNERFRADKLADAFKTEHEQLVMAHGALITQHVRANTAEARIAELKKFISQSCYVFDGRDADISDAYIDASTSGLMPKVGDSNEVKPCSYCSDGSYSGLPGGACEHCMGTGLDNPAAGIGKGE